MRMLAYILIALALGCEVFAYWGLYTVSGRRAFDEMAGIIPWAAQFVGLFLFLGAAFIWWRSRAPS
jgi:hypothetical protein